MAAGRAAGAPFARRAGRCRAIGRSGMRSIGDAWHNRQPV